MVWDATTDVLVVGFGAAGACAGLEARAAGAEVLAVDRFNGGGATELSGGIVYAGGGTAVQREAGIGDTADAMFAYLAREVGDAVRPETLRRFVDSSPEMIDWLMGHGVPFEASVCTYKTSYPDNRYYLYYSGSECSGEFRAVTPPVQRGHRAKGRGASGKMIYQPLARAAFAAGVRFRPHTRVVALESDDSGRVIGVRARTMADAPASVRRSFAAMAAVAAKPGIYYPPLRRVLEGRLEALERRYAREIRIRARGGVILCAGGYIANREMLARYAPGYTGGLALGTTGDDGSGIELGLAAGGTAERMDNVSAWRFIAPPSAFYSGLLVNEEGRRFIDETRYGAAVGNALVREQGGKGWLLVDAALMGEARKQLASEAIWFQRLQAESMLRTSAVRADTVEEVARRAGISPEGLAATIRAHNEAIAGDRPDPQGKPREFTHPIEKGPFTLLDVSVRPKLTNPCPMFSLGGLVVDENTGAAHSSTGDPIPGLYVAGRSAIGICSESYVSGLSIADCVFSGRRAGRFASAELSETAA
ncbi:3-oxo-5alpha-steroid 4-dehydrogenase [Nocardia transvalensis]|uniref:3-oxo-5alpha-steroid 4-dehydrogenase n=1 Tax=Nocardia transvalensis TaxID=37333 RepID=A0A7W9UKG9_9NOCA|nr:FAD-binding protein [Nocardia transvalensis]MBB5916548.1 3-oxo-5alpha-steroid 4-dehydrogenase [Nocardia transvalensis]